MGGRRVLHSGGTIGQLAYSYRALDVSIREKAWLGCRLC